MCSSDLIDTTGHGKTISKFISMLSDNGRFILVAQPKPEDQVAITNTSVMFSGNGHTIKATQGGKTNPTDDIPRYINLYKSGLLKINSIITHRFSLDEINLAIETLKSGKAGRIIIDINNK